MQAPLSFYGCCLWEIIPLKDVVFARCSVSRKIFCPLYNLFSIFVAFHGIFAFLPISALRTNRARSEECRMQNAELKIDVYRYVRTCVVKPPFVQRFSSKIRRWRRKATEGLYEAKRILIPRTIPHPLRGSPLYTKGPWCVAVSYHQTRRQIKI